jgi:RNA polymerase-binding protein DksA
LIDEIHDSLAKSGNESFIELAGRVHDAGEESVAEWLMTMNLDTSQRETHELADIEGALARIRVGRYGACIDCGQEIKCDRLQAYPAAKRCINCQTLHEKRRGGRDATPSL